MVQSNISNDTTNIQGIEKNKDIFVHIAQPEFLPVGYVFVAASNIEQLTDNYYDNISIGDLFDYVAYTQMVSLLDTLITKLSSGGKIQIQSVDFYQLCSSITFDDIDIDTAKTVIYTNKKQNIYNLKQIETEMVNRNLDIVEKKYINIFEYFISATKL
jgi:hypothetical protein